LENFRLSIFRISIEPITCSSVYPARTAFVANAAVTDLTGLRAKRDRRISVCIANPSNSSAYGTDDGELKAEGFFIDAFILSSSAAQV